jgi:O-antigen/teichoic acid export membrane protein
MKVLDFLRSAYKSSLAKTFRQSFIISFIARFGQLAMSVLTARLLSPDGFGVFTFATGLALVVGRVGSMGWPTLMQRFVPRYVVAENWAMLRGLVQTASWLMLGLGLIVGSMMVGLAYWLGTQHHLFYGVALAGILLPAMMLRYFYRNLLASLKAPNYGILLDELIPSFAMTLVLIVPFILPYRIISTPFSAIMAYIAASCIAVVFGIFLLRQKIPMQTKTVQPQYELRLWMITAWPAMVGITATLFMSKSDVLMLPALSSLDQVGYYGAALRLTYIQTAPVIVLSTVLISRISEAIAANRPKQAQRLFVFSLLFALGVSLPFALTLGLWPEAILTLIYGAEYMPAAPALTWLSIGQVGAAMNMSATAFMLMTGRQVRYGQITTVGLGLNLILNWLLIPKLGAEGAALATAVSVWSLNAMQLLACLSVIRSGRYGEVAPKDKIADRDQ